MFGKSKAYDKLRKLEKGIRQSFEKIKEEMDNHLDTINKNTDEIQMLYDYLTEVDSKIEKLSERMDNMEMVLDPQMEALACNLSLNKKEQEVFVVLYTADDKVTTEEIAQTLGYTEEMVLNYLYNLISKDIPIIKECRGETMLLSLNPKFEDLQAKKNVLNIEESVAKEVRLRH